MKKKVKKKIVIAGAVLLLIAAVGGVCIWHNHAMKALRDDYEHQQAANNAELDSQTQDALERLADENESLREAVNRATEEKSELQKLADDLKKELDKVTNPVVVVDAEQVEAEIRSISELATIEYKYTNVGVFSGEIDFDFDFDWVKGKKIPFTGKEAVISMDGTIKAGIDFSKVKVVSDDGSKTVTVKLPASQYLSNELDEESLKTIIDEQSVFNKLKQEDHNYLRKQIKETAVEYADKNNILQQADDRARLLITDIIEAIPNFKGNYEIKFETIE
ncbi:MAG: DUF4230 domain-containing protein [Oscillospiraceae bacterium]|nr:DUF4230 domain-containing protein [Oscillospiraceae bacterium]